MLRAIAQQHLRGREIPKNKKNKKNRGSESIATDKTASLQGVCLMEIFVTEF
jgi:hypothetical protein